MKKNWFGILVALAESPLHGADVRRRVTEVTDGQTKLYPVTLYRSLDELAARGLIEEVAAPEEAPRHNEVRRYFAITGDGRRELYGEIERLESLAARARRAVEG